MTGTTKILGTLKDGSVITDQSLYELIETNKLNVILDNAIIKFIITDKYGFDKFNLDKFLRNDLYNAQLISARRMALVNKKYNSLDDNKTNTKKAYNAIKTGLKEYYSTNNYNKQHDVRVKLSEISLTLGNEQSTNGKLRRAIWEQLKQ